MAIQNASKHIMVAIIVILLTSTTIFASLPMAEAAKVRACSTNASPKGVAAASSTEVWLANDGGTLQKFTSLASNCNKTSYTVNGDPHFIDRSSSTKITYTNHVFDKITYFNPSTSTKVDCTNTSIDGPDDIVSYDSNTQFSTAYSSGKIIKTVKGTSSCTVTAYVVPGTSPNPEGIDKSPDVNGMFFVDQKNKKLYKIAASTGAITLVRDLTLDTVYTPWFVADSNDNGNFVWITFRDSGILRAYATVSGALVETSPSLGTGNNVFDIAVISQGVPIVTWYQDPKISKYDYGTDTWTTHDWNTKCSGCDGFGIDTVSSGTYYAALRSLSGTSKIVTGSF